MTQPRSAPPSSVTSASVVDNVSSPHSRLRSIPIDSVRIDDDFWSPRLKRNRTETLPFAHGRCQDTGAFENFRRAAGHTDGPFHGRYYSDSDVYKWVESASWALAAGEDRHLRPLLDHLVQLIAGAQDTDGYLNTYFSVDRVEERWSDITFKHEMYCLGHLVQAAVAHFRATADESLLNVALRAGELVERRFPPGRIMGACGHPNLEMALVELYRTTGDDRWLRLAEWQLASRGHGVLDGSEYLLDHAPVREQRRVTGHAVRAVYLYAAMADVALETGDAELCETLDALWNDMTRHKMSVTGGVGSRWDGEAFGGAYELPDRAYNESCAAIATIFWAWRMLLRTGDGRFREVIEHSLYNAVLPGLSQDGKDFFYQNPLADGGNHRRQPWFDCACCPPNITRLLATLPGYACSTSDDGVWLHLIMGLEATIQLPWGHEMILRTTSTIPFGNSLDVRVTLEQSTRFTLRIPAPSWSPELAVTINDVDTKADVVAGYLVLTRDWNDDDRVSVTYAAPVRLLASHPHVSNAHHRVAITKGPLVYCLEQVDHLVDIQDVRLSGDEEWKPETLVELTDVVALRTTASVRRPSEFDALYSVWDPDARGSMHPTELTAIPYFAWANRSSGRMTVLLPVE